MAESTVPTVAVVGAGLMGHGIAQVFMAADFTVSVWDPDASALSQVPSRIAEHLDLMKLDRPVVINLASSLAEAVGEADFVFEAAPENLVVKRELMHEIDRYAPNAVVATNTSVLRISEIAQGSARPERVIGAHWWNPPYLIPVVEVVAGRRTSRQTVSAVTELLKRAGKLPVLVSRDAPGFIGNRMQFALWREAMNIIAEGIGTAEAVDLVARHTFGLRLATIGPLENADFIGLDLTVAIMDYLLPSLSADSQAPDVVRRAVAEGQLGAKSGMGLYKWPPGARDSTERRLLQHLLKLRDAPTVEHI